MKIYTVIKERRGNKTQQTGTMVELLNHYGYTLECGKSWEHESGNSKINLNPKSGPSLIKQLNNADSNSAANGYSLNHYTLQ